MDASTLAPYAVNEAVSRGRRFAEDAPQYRGQFQRDRDRIVHSAAFRRLEYKTQVFVNHEGDLFRTRLTHSIEVAQIGRSIARTLQLNEDLTEAIALAHDLGHTPFGHAGQEALNQCMADYGGFEHNLQSLRVVDELEERYAEFSGLNLCFETREGILKHCSRKNAEMLGDVGQRFLLGQQASLEAQLANLADEIAYNNHDVDDGLRSGLINMGDLLQLPLFEQQYQVVLHAYPDLNERRIVHEVVRRMINVQVVNLVETSIKNLQDLNITHVDQVREQKQAVLGFDPNMQVQHVELKRFLRKNLYQHFRVHRMANKARRVIDELFTAFMQDARLLPPEPYARSQELKHAQGEHGLARGIADYIAGMTDRFAIKEYERIFDPRSIS